MVAPQAACLNLQRFLSAEMPYNRVDKKLGFPHPSVVWRPGPAESELAKGESL